MAEHLQLRRITPEIDRIIIQEQAKKLAKKGVWQSKEQIVYDIIKEWDEQNKILKTKK